MKEEKVTIRKALGSHWRGAKELHKVNRRYFAVCTLYSVIAAVTPYVGVFFSAQILKELALLRRTEVLWTWVAAGVICTGLCAVLKAFLYQRNETLYDDLYGRKELLFCRKMFSMDYADMDRQEIHDLREQIQQNENWNSWGLMRIPQSYEYAVKSVMGILTGAALTVTLFTSPVPETAGALTFLNHPAFVLVLAAVMVLVSILAGKFNTLSMAAWGSIGEEATFGNRLFGFFGFIGIHKGRGVDIRMYSQQDLVSAYWSGNTAFGALGPVARVVRGKMGIYSGLGTAITVLITGFMYVFTCLKAWGGAFDIGSITQYVGAATAMAGSIFELTALLGILKTNTPHLEKAFEYLDIPNAMYQGSLTTEKRADRQYEVEFKDVSFRYPGSDIWALRHVNIYYQISPRKPESTHLLK